MANINNVRYMVCTWLTDRWLIVANREVIGRFVIKFQFIITWTSATPCLTLSCRANEEKKNNNNNYYCKFSFRPTKRSQELRQIKCDYPIFMVIRQEREVIIKIVYWVKARARQKSRVKKFCFDCHSITWKSFFYRL